MHGAGNSHLMRPGDRRPTAEPGPSFNDQPSATVPQSEGTQDPTDGFGVPARYLKPMATQSIAVWTPVQLAGALFRWVRARLVPAAPLNGASTDTRG